MRIHQKKSYEFIMVFLLSFVMLFTCSKTVNAATYNTTAYYGLTQEAVQQANAKLATGFQMDAGLNKIALQLAVDMSSGEGYDFEIGFPNRIKRLQEKTGNYKSWMFDQSGFVYAPENFADAQEKIVSGLVYAKKYYPDYNLAGIAIMTNDRTKTYRNCSCCYVILLGKGTCTPETKTGTKVESITVGATVQPTETSTTSSTSKVKVSKVKITAPAKTLITGKKMTLKASVSPSNASNKAVTWSSSNKKYATVSSKGVVTANAAGAGKTVTITAKAKDGSGKKTTYKIQIKGAVKKISLKAAKSVKAGKKVTVKATVSVGKGGSKALKWTTSNKNYATVSSKGVVTAKKAGKGKTVTITATAKDGSGKKASVKIKIK